MQWIKSITWHLQLHLQTTCTIPSKPWKPTLLVLWTCLVSPCVYWMNILPTLFISGLFCVPEARRQTWGLVLIYCFPGWEWGRCDLLGHHEGSCVMCSTPLMSLSTLIQLDKSSLATVTLCRIFLPCFRSSFRVAFDNSFLIMHISLLLFCTVGSSSVFVMHWKVRWAGHRMS